MQHRAITLAIAAALAIGSVATAQADEALKATQIKPSASPVTVVEINEIGGTLVDRSGAPRVIRTFRPRLGPLQSPEPVGLSRVQVIGPGADRGSKITVVSEATRRARVLATDPVVATRVANTLTRDGLILTQGPERDALPLIAVDPREIIDDRLIGQLRRDNPYITAAQAERAERSMRAARSQWERETGLTSRVMQFSNPNAERMYDETTQRRAINHEPSAIIVPRGELMSHRSYPQQFHNVSTIYTPIVRTYHSGYRDHCSKRSHKRSKWNRGSGLSISISTGGSHYRRDCHRPVIGGYHGKFRHSSSFIRRHHSGCAPKIVYRGCR